MQPSFYEARHGLYAHVFHARVQYNNCTETGKVYFKENVKWDFLERAEDVLLSVMMFCDAYQNILVPLAHSQMSLMVFQLNFEFTRYRGVERTELILDKNCEKGELFDVFRGNYDRSEW